MKSQVLQVFQNTPSYGMIDLEQSCGERAVRDGEPNMYGGIASLLAGHETGLRTYATAFLTFNVIAFPVVFGSNQPEAVKLGVSIIGAVVHPTLLNLALRELRWVRTLRQRLHRLELLDQGDASGVRERLFSDLNIVRPVGRTNVGVLAVLILGLAAMLFWSREAFVHYITMASGTLV